MSSFQFPANPSDGDIVVRGNLQAFYNAATNTWRVSEVPTAPGIPGPPGPPGPEGPPGKGVEVSGVVDTFADLPAPNAHQFEYWIVSDTNTLYISDGIQWVTLGGPIQGPPGQDGNDGDAGTNGQNGRGWYDTNIIDERPTNYQIEFKSNDGLGFTTDNIMGPAGASSQIPVASETVLGGIKIGRGLSIDETGTASAGITTVDLETTPLAPGNFALPTVPTYVEFECIQDDGVSTDNGKSRDALGAYSETEFMVTEPVAIQMPNTANAAIVTWSAPSIFDVAYAESVSTWTNGMTLNFRSYLSHYLLIEGADIIGRPSGTDYSGKPVAHNYNPTYGEKTDGTSSITGKFTTNSFNKMEYIVFPEGSEVTLTVKTDITDMSTGTITVGGVRAWVQPFKLEDDGSNPFILAPEFERIENRLNSLTPGEINDLNAADLRKRTFELIRDIDSLLLLYEGDQDNLDHLNQVKTDALNIVNLPGTYADLNTVLSGLAHDINMNYLSNDYRFQ